MGKQFSDAQFRKCRHVLGLNVGDRVYRNWWLTSAPDHDLDDLVDRGFAERRTSPMTSGFVYKLSKQCAKFFMVETDRFDGETKFPIISHYPECKVTGYEA